MITKKSIRLGYGGWIEPNGTYHRVDFEGHDDWIEGHPDLLPSDDIYLSEDLIEQGWLRFITQNTNLIFDMYTPRAYRIVDAFLFDNSLTFDYMLISTYEPSKFYNISKEEYEEADFNLAKATRHSRDIRGMKKLSYDDYEDTYNDPYIEDSLYGEADLKADKTDLRSVLKDLLLDVDETIKDPDLKYQKQEEINNLLRELKVADNEVEIQDIRDRTNTELDYIEQAGEENFYTGYDFPEREPTGLIQHPGGGLHLQDTSTERLLKLVEGGYTHAIWNLHEMHPEEDVCDSLHGQVFRLEDLVLGLQHNAPIFEKTHPNCYSESAEVYTKEGFKKFKDLKKKEKVATVNIDTQELEWQEPISYTSYSYKGNMLRFKSKNINTLVTPDHNMYIRMAKKTPYKRDKRFRLVAAKDLIKKEKGKIIRTNKGMAIPIVVKATKNKSKQVKIGNLLLNEIDYCKLMGYYLSEGSVLSKNSASGKKSYNKYFYQIDITQTKKNHKKTMKKDLLKLTKSININLREHSLGFSFSNKDLFNYFRQFGKSYEKYIPTEVKECSREGLEAFLDAYILGDGNISIMNSLPGQIIDSVSKTIFTSSIRLADDLCEIILKTGHSVSYKNLGGKGKPFTIGDKTWVTKHDCIRISIKNSKVVLAFKVSEETYDGKVYCVSVPNKTLIIRDNGKVFICGNCICWLLVYSEYDADLPWRIIDSIGPEGPVFA